MHARFGGGKSEKYQERQLVGFLSYKVHLTQTCDEDLPQLIAHVETTHAALPDGKALSGIHADLADKDLLPNQHLADSGYIDATNLHESRVSYEVDLVGPTLKHDWYQAGTDYDLTHFSIDWDAQAVTCPQGHISSSWTPAEDPKGRPVIKIKFSQTDCRSCPGQTACTGQSRRTLTLQPRERMQALLAARQREDTAAFKDTYRHRAGIEGTHSQGARAMGLRRSRYVGKPKTHLAHVAIATAVNLVQLAHWLNGDVPEQTRTSAFKRVMKLVA